MKSLPVPKEEQIRAMLSSSVREILAEYVVHPPAYSFKKYLTVSRTDIVQFLISHPDDTVRYFRRYDNAAIAHDGELLLKEDGRYVVATIDHGARRSIRYFDSMANAVAEHVLVSYGMY